MEDNRTDYERFEDTMALLKLKNKYVGNTYEISNSIKNIEHEFYFKNFDQLKNFIIKSDETLQFENINKFIKSIELKVLNQGFDLDSSFGLKLS